MAKPKTVRFGMFAIMLGTLVASPVYSAPCGFTSKSLALTKDLTEIVLPDCDSPDTASWVGRDVASMSAAVTGEGVLAEESVKTWLAAYDSIEPVPVKIVLTLSTETVTWTGHMHIASLTVEGENGGRCSLNVDMQSDGELIKVIAPKV
ncbi:phage tail tube protein [Rhizobium herbae]|uniref:Secreted protein n=1 Tax=Rhizobium herbae TaxID=508661 RepID=A0ABS4EFP3_9HYPH|nr:phage tail tube protein [Rhizobium herbae]MBP1856769.1 putative secreted protein [Rhizobium herbae]